MILQIGSQRHLKNAAQVSLFRHRRAQFGEVIVANLTIQQYSGAFVKTPQNPHMSISPTIFL